MIAPCSFDMPAMFICTMTLLLVLFWRLDRNYSDVLQFSDIIFKRLDICFCFEYFVKCHLTSLAILHLCSRVPS